MEEVVVTTSAEDIGDDGIKILTKLDQKPIEQAMKSKRKSLAPKVGRIEVGAGDTSSRGICHSQGTVPSSSQGICHSKGAIPSQGVCHSSQGICHSSQGVCHSSQGICHSKGAILSLGVSNSSQGTIPHSRAALEVSTHDIVEEDIPSESERSLVL